MTEGDVMDRTFEDVFVRTARFARALYGDQAAVVMTDLGDRVGDPATAHVAIFCDGSWHKIAGMSTEGTSPADALRSLHIVLSATVRNKGEQLLAMVSA